MELTRRVERMVEEVRRRFAPDPRVAVFDVGVVEREGVVVLLGASSEAEAVEALRHGAAALEGGPPVVDEVVLLPIPEAERSHAIVSSATAPMLAGPLVMEAPISQLVHGEGVTVLRRHGPWVQCRSRDGYIGWIHRGYLIQTGESEARAWEVGAPGTQWISLGAEVRDPATEDILARLPWGSRFQRDRSGAAVLPDGRTGRLTGPAIAASDRPERFPLEADAVLRTAATWLGAPYHWGGVTPAGVDCSGFVQAVLGMHGRRMPRDSDHQAAEGEPVVLDADFSGARPGDLVFFAEIGRRITHVAFSLGGSEILHAAVGNGGVKANDLRGQDAYERELAALVVGARRVIAQES